MSSTPSRRAEEAPARGAPRRRPGPVGGRRDTNRRRKVEALSAAGLRLFLDRGIEAVTIEEITAEAGTAKGGFYRYFEGKDALVEALFDPLRASVREAFSRCEAALSEARTARALRPAYERLAQDLVEVLAGNLDVVRLYLQEGRGPDRPARAPVRAVGAEVARGALALTEAAHRHGLLRPIDPRVSSLAVVGAVERLLFAALCERQELPLLEVPGALISLVLDGLRAEP